MERSSVRPNGGGVNAVPLAPAAGSHSHKPLRLSQLPPSRASCGRGYSGSGAALVGSMVAPQRVTMSASLPGTFAEQRCRCHGTRGDPAATVAAAEGVKIAAARADTVAIRRSDSGTAIGSNGPAAGAGAAGCMRTHDARAASRRARRELRPRRQCPGCSPGRR